MAVSKVVYNNNGVQETLIDVSQDTVTQSDVAQGVTFHNAQGIQQVGTATGGASLGTKTITANGTYQASSEGYDGYSDVNVNVTTPDALSKALIEGTLTSIGPSELSNVDSIGTAAFAFKPNLQSVQIPDTITALQGYTFTMCPNLTSITLPSTLTTLGESEFSGSSSLSTLTYNGSTESSPCLPSSLTSIGANCFSEFPMSGAITIPGGVTELFGSTFYGAHFSTIIFEEGLITLGEDEFGEGNSLQYLTIPSTFTGFSTRYSYPLHNHSSFNTVTFNNTLINMINTGWLLQPNYVTSIPAHNIVCTDYTLPYGGQDNVTITYNNGGTSTMGNGQDVYYSSMSGTGNITSASFSSDLTVIGKLNAGIYSNYGSTFSITLPSSLKVIQYIDDATTPQPGTYITSLTIPSSVVYLGDPDRALFATQAYQNNAHITTLILECTTPPYLGTGSLGTLNALTSIVVPQGTLSTYQNDAQWSQYSSIISEGTPTGGPYATVTEDGGTTYQIDMGTSGYALDFSNNSNVISVDIGMTASEFNQAGGSLLGATNYTIARQYNSGLTNYVFFVNDGYFSISQSVFTSGSGTAIISGLTWAGKTSTSGTATITNNDGGYTIQIVPRNGATDFVSIDATLHPDMHTITSYQLNLQ